MIVVFNSCGFFFVLLFNILMLPSLRFHWLLILIHWNARFCVCWLNELNFLRWPLDIIGIHEWIVHLSMTFLNFYASILIEWNFCGNFHKPEKCRGSERKSHTFLGSKLHECEHGICFYIYTKLQSKTIISRETMQLHLSRRKQDYYTAPTFLHIKPFYKQIKLRWALLDL